MGSTYTAALMLWRRVLYANNSKHLWITNYHFMHKNKLAFPVLILLPTYSSDLYYQHLRRKCINSELCLILSPKDLGRSPCPINLVGTLLLTSVQPRFLLLLCCNEAGGKSNQVPQQNQQIPTHIQIWGNNAHKQACTLNKSLNYLALCIYGLYTNFNIRKYTIHPVKYLYAFWFTLINSYTNAGSVDVLCKGETLEDDIKWTQVKLWSPRKIMFKFSLISCPVPHNASNSSYWKPYFALW